ncbi:MAG: hypothetical protein RI922_431 [Bacteroidota bacterium]|jgi:uncharacterized membrane protein YqaE (UPF0057 family)
MKIKLMLSVSLIATLILGSCASSNEVTGGGFLQKRKYTNGVYFKGNGNLKGTSAKNDEEELDIFKVEERHSKKYVTSTTASTETTSELETVFSEESVKAEEMNVLSDGVTAENNSKTKTISAVEAEESNNIESQKEAKQLSKKVSLLKKTQKAPAGDVELILLVILALIIPPLAVYLYEGATQRFWIDLILAILGLGVGLLFIGGWLCALVSVIYALLIVLEVI